MNGTDWIGQTSMDAYAPSDVSSYEEVIIEKLCKIPGQCITLEHPSHFGDDYYSTGIKIEQRALMEEFGLRDLDKFVVAIKSLYMKRLIVIHWTESRNNARFQTKIALTRKFTSVLKVEISE